MARLSPQLNGHPSSDRLVIEMPQLPKSLNCPDLAGFGLEFAVRRPTPTYAHRKLYACNQSRCAGIPRTDRAIPGVRRSCSRSPSRRGSFCASPDYGIAGVDFLFNLELEAMPLMSKKKQPFIIDNDLSAELKPYLPSDVRATVECGLRPNAPDYPDVVDLCQEEEAMLVAADTEFPDHLRRYQREHNTCWGLVLLPSDEK
jgi:hypothetical protein